MRKSVSCEELGWSSQNTQVSSLVFFKLSSGFLLLYNRSQHVPAVYSEDLWSSWSILSPISLSLYCSHSACGLVIQHSSQTPTWGSLRPLWISTFSAFSSEASFHLPPFTVYSKVPASVRLFHLFPHQDFPVFIFAAFFSSEPSSPSGVCILLIKHCSQENVNYHRGRFCFVSVPLMPTAPKTEKTQIKHLFNECVLGG